MGANGLAAPGTLVSPTIPQSDIRSNPGNNRPMTASDISSSGSVGNCQADKLQPVIRKRRGGSRRACNECKQQKLRCDIVQVPSATCSRCRRLGIDCKVEPTFKRISKRRRNAEMEREIADLRQRLENGEHRPQPSFDINPTERIDQPSEVIFRGTASPSTRVPPLHASVETQQALQTPLSLRATEPPILLDDDNAWSLEDITISKATVARLFQQYFKYYHPFLPLLDPMKGADEYMRSSLLLAWTIIFVASRRAPSEPGLLGSLTQPFSRLLWSTITTVPQNYHVVKALCLLCTWPLPTTSQRSDPTFMLSGLMMQVAMQLGLHRPVQAEEFTTFRIEVRGEELKDRLQTWIICNIVAQHVATGYGQPPGTIYDWAIEPTSLKVADYRIPEEIRIRLRIEKFCDRVTKGLYSSKPDPADFATAEKLLIVRILEGELKEMELEFGQDISQINMIHLRAADLHLRYFVFLGTNARIEDLTNLFVATTSFLGRVLDLETSPGNLLSHATNYILQMVVSAAFALMKLLKSSFSRQIDLDQGKFLFNGAISAIRRISVMDHDRPVRLADVLSQMWNASGSGSSATGDDALQLKVRCRMSMSHVYDTVWRWRQRFRPTKPTDDTQSSSVSNQNPDLSASGPVTQPQDNSLNDPTLFLSPFDHNGGIISEASFSDVFDSLNWVFDGIPDSFAAPPAV
ncbi:transcriptional regulator family: Fungal Specific TF [Paecilomyces variotii]|nr:transcriptional regulator family: Fungal Specific TF [Paecilomyces variotii]KAJ9286304.1 transcriptional regulator family: Fungal Specific TF [Paecilomyces variotii]KAJ9303775.1 transcriptional regulator family: Fungal Specific TF [Paecilomyces variotii]KAJ9312298.1 transcriptional regulator family: Fungal Specific TF [Paecilomyces variotii]KAJ9328364.1 transcriptional regulator family: Fungal Specific TF [Paecilomyces variotii]